MTEIIFDRIRPLFKGKLTKGQVAGIEAIVSAWDAHGDGDLAKLAYLLGTTRLETADTFQPIRERGNGDGPDADKWDDYLEKYDTGKLAKALGNTPAADGDGVLYAGRGYVMITGLANYQKASKKLGADFVSNPDLALKPEWAALILIRGCLEGWFTGKKLGTYIKGVQNADYINARRVVNGLDRASDIAEYATSFYRALETGIPVSDTDAHPIPETPASEAPIVEEHETTISPPPKPIKHGVVGWAFLLAAVLGFVAIAVFWKF